MSLAGECWNAARIRYRFVAYAILYLILFTEMISRFGAPIAMISGMVKKNCSDISDTGSFCWSETVKATVLGAFFYGYSFQFVGAFAARYLGVTRVLRSWMLLSAVIIACYPYFASLSTTLLITTQVFRGITTGVMVSNNFEFVRKWSLPRETNYVISLIGVIIGTGTGVGPLLAEFLTSLFGWRYYFYLTGAAFLLVLCLNTVLVTDTPADSPFMTDEEKQLFVTETTGGNCKDGPPGAGGNCKDGPPGAEGCCKDGPPGKDEPTPWSEILSRRYLWAFAIYMISYNFIYYSTLSVAPFYLNEVLGVTSGFISWMNLGLGITLSISALLFSRLFQQLDKHMSWVKCRMLFTLLPMLIQALLFVIFPQVTQKVLVVVVLVFSAISAGTLFSGSVVTINYELDPLNASLIVVMFNSVGQCAGFLGPLLMAEVTETDPLTPDYDSVYRTRWSHFFYIVSGFAVMGLLSIVATYRLRPTEWVPYRQRKEMSDVVVVNPVAKS